ncbi:Fic family protein [hydrothermal vent metagenome]|uniref:Fic family protein n=1 Tax=hydrothermal vent metagenome TaxID=652676 RepID=A0A3B0ZCP2_9ZZZZ
MDWQNFRLSTRLQFSAQLVEEIYSKIAEIDAVKNTFRLTHTLLPQTIERLTHSVIVTSTGASNRIEGNKLSDDEVETLYKSMRIKSFRTRDEQEVTGYLEVLQTVFENYSDIPITESSILQLHKNMLTFSDKDQRHMGQYKFGSNRVEAKDQNGNAIGVIFDPTPPHLTQKEMQELVAWYGWASEAKFKHPLILIASFIFEYLAIHPFQDGNGRTSRLLVNLMLLQHGYSFASLVSHEKLIEQSKVDYYLALNKTQKSWKSDNEDLSAWLVYLFDIFHEQAVEAQKILESDQFEYLLSEKQMEFWQWAKEQKTFSRKTAVEALGFAPRTVEDITKKLLDMKKLERLGQGRATRYRVVG